MQLLIERNLIRPIDEFLSKIYINFKKYMNLKNKGFKNLKF